jgi:CheY-like chemotaxis protein
MTAATVCARLRGSPTTAHVPIILSSTRFNIDSQTYLAELGADMLLSKPFRPDDLLSLFAQFSL